MSIVERPTFVVPEFDTGLREENEARDMGSAILLGTWRTPDGDALTFHRDGTLRRAYPRPMPFAFVPECVAAGRWRWIKPASGRPPVLVVDTKPTYCACRMNGAEVPPKDCQQRIDGHRQRFRVIAPNVDTVYLEPDVTYRPQCLCRTKDCTCTDVGQVSV
ncbi:MAG: hypothetical protein ACOC1F_10255, partial [Myxococcota bacterium]